MILSGLSDNKQLQPSLHGPESKSRQRLLDLCLADLLKYICNLPDGTDLLLFFLRQLWVLDVYVCMATSRKEPLHVRLQTQTFKISTARRMWTAGWRSVPYRTDPSFRKGFFAMCVVLHISIGPDTYCCAGNEAVGIEASLIRPEWIFFATKSFVVCYL